MNIAEIRKQYPQYDDLSDEQLARGLHSKFYSDMDFGDFSQKIGLTQQKEIKPNIQPLTDEQKAKPKATNWVDIAKEFMSGFGEGAVSGVESAVNGATLGGYGWLDRKLGLGMQDRRDKLQERAEEAGVGGLNQGAQLLAEIGGNIAGGGGALAKQASKMGLKGLKGALAANTAEGLAYGLTDSDKLEDIPANVAKNVIAGNAIPLGLRGVAVGGKGVGKLLGATTGTGDAIVNAFGAGVRKSKDFLDNMRGKINATDVVDKAKSRFDEVSKGGNNAFGEEFNKIKDVKVNFNRIKNAYNKLADEKILKGTDVASSGERKVLNEVGDLIKKYEKNPRLHTVEGMQKLKENIDGISNFKADDSYALRARTIARNSVKDAITEQAPEYGKLMDAQSALYKELDEYKNVLGMKNNLSPARSLKKLQSALRNDAISGYGNNATLVSKLQGDSNELVDALSGQALNSWSGRGVLSNALSKISALSAGAGLFNPAIFSPEVLMAVAASSPRAMGEVAYKLGQAKRLSSPVSKRVANYLDDYTASLINILENQ